MKIPVLYTTFNRLEYTKRTLPRLIEATPEADIYVVDNASTDGTQDYLDDYRADLLQSLGYPDAVDRVDMYFKKNNIGIANVMNWFFDKTKDHEYVAKVDNDTMVPDGWLPKMIEAAKIGKVDVLQAKHHFIIARYKNWNEMENDQRVENLNGCPCYFCGEKIVRYPFVGGSGVVIRRTAIREDIKSSGHIFGWSVYQDERPEIKSAFYPGVWIDLLDMAGYNKYAKDANMKYYSDTGRLELREVDAQGNVRVLLSNRYKKPGQV